MGKWGKDDLTEKIIGACIKVHKTLGPGFLEIIYLNALFVELKNLGFQCESEKEVRIFYEGSLVGVHKIDLLVEGVGGDEPVESLLEARGSPLVDRCDDAQAEIRSWRATGGVTRRSRRFALPLPNRASTSATSKPLWNH